MSWPYTASFAMFAELEGKYFAYVDTFRVGGELPEMMELKLLHTRSVVSAARMIAEGEGFENRTACALEAAALLHDTGRYEQLKRFNTFRDADSVDHAVFSHDIVKEKGWLDGWEDASAILTAVLVHNRRDIPAAEMDDLTLDCSRALRDADKLDIFNVLEDRVSNTDWRRDSRAFWNLETHRAPSAEVVEALLEERTVDYQHIKCLADFVMVQVGWMILGLEYATSCRICLERGHLGFRRRFLGELTDDPVVDVVCAKAEAALKKRLTEREDVLV